MIQLNVQIVFDAEYKGLTFKDALYIYTEKAGWEVMSDAEVAQDVGARLQAWAGLLNEDSTLTNIRAEVDRRVQAWKDSVDNPAVVPEE